MKIGVIALILLALISCGKTSSAGVESRSGSPVPSGGQFKPKGGGGKGGDDEENIATCRIIMNKLTLEDDEKCKLSDNDAFDFGIAPEIVKCLNGSLIVGAIVYISGSTDLNGLDVSCIE